MNMFNNVVATIFGSSSSDDDQLYWRQQSELAQSFKCIFDEIQKLKDKNAELEEKIKQLTELLNNA